MSGCGVRRDDDGDEWGNGWLGLVLAMLTSSRGISISALFFYGTCSSLYTDCADCRIRSCWCVLAFALALVGVCAGV